MNPKDEGRRGRAAGERLRDWPVVARGLRFAFA